MALYLRILSYLRPHAWVWLAAVVAAFLFAALDAFSLALLIPFLHALFAEAPEGVGRGAPDPSPIDGGDRGAGLLERLLDLTVGRFVDAGSDPGEAVLRIILFILVVFIVKNLFDFARSYLVARVEQGVTKDLRDEVYDHLLHLDLAFFGRTRTGQIISRLTHDVEQLRTLLTRELTKVVSSLFELLAAVTLMVSISGRLTLAAFVVVPGTMAVWGPLVGHLRRGDRRVLDLAGDIHSHLQETVSGIRLVKSASAESHERSRFRRLTGDYFTTYVKTERLRALAAPITEMLAALGIALILGYGARLVLSPDGLDPGMFIGFLALSMKLYAPMKYISKFPALVQPGLVGGERVFEFLDAPVRIEDQEDAMPFNGLREEIAYEAVSFAYRPGEEVLRDISFRAPRGSVVALVGRSGSGKSTLVDLLGRFHDVGSGRLLIDGIDVREFSIGDLRRNLGIVSQETVLFHDSVEANIAYGLEGSATRAQIERAARAAHAHPFIVRLPDGYETVVGERGVHLSGGQRQRIAIARALLRDPPILIFDEATSALDSESERLVQQAIDRLLRGRTVFVIAHRLSTVRRADQILVLDGGRIVERGDHETLFRAGGLYRHLHEIQAAAPGEDAGRGELPSKGVRRPALDS